MCQVEVVADATVAFSAKTVKVAKKGKATFTVTITPPKNLSGKLVCESSTCQFESIKG